MTFSNALPAGSSWEESDEQTPRPGLRASLRRAWPNVWPLLLVGLGVRLLFLLVGAKIYYAGRQGDIYNNGDSYSYILSFHNLLQYGRYSFDLLEPDAAVGRMPGYPFFYGLHYLVFDRFALLAVAVTQVLLDTLGIWLLYVVTARLAPARSWAPLVAALLLTFYPFSIVWVTIIGTETLGLFLVLLWWATLLLARPRTRNWVLLGVLLAVILYVREFLGVCLAITVLYLLRRAARAGFRVGAVRPLAFVVLGFLSLYVWWPMRNYATMGRFIPLKPAAAGYASLREDTQAALAWILTWTNDVTMGIDEILLAKQPAFPAHVISTPAEKQLIDSLVVLSRTCASSFHVRATLYAAGAGAPDTSENGLEQYRQAQLANTLRHRNCNPQVAAGFQRLQASYEHRHPIRSRVEVPLQNLRKILFKSQFKTAAGTQMTMAQRISSLLFTWRSILLVIGLAGAWRYRKLPGLRPALLFSAVIFGYMAIIFRSMEMRYLLQADVFMLVPAALLLAGWIPRRWSRTAPPEPAD
ncbi:glycosyltransferase family protein [Hymenobacter yonginensis]|uniref:Glycosyltransferase family 39 protein n=1 Tax=Hymenobacter yonginensis TaxID=748197 RepID=A0ABY7PPP6_9BACT|nr:glycosyltransferase family 39 protein [Hymenobacter yonginensis]WBO84957.1 glycosyltransferase family 39 protein [Hymenobacter yonginensis]